MVTNRSRLARYKLSTPGADTASLIITDQSIVSSVGSMFSAKIHTIVDAKLVKNQVNDNENNAHF